MTTDETTPTVAARGRRALRTGGTDRTRRAGTARRAAVVQGSGSARRAGAARRAGTARPRTTWREVLRAVNLGLSLGLVLIVGGLATILIVIPKATGSTPLTVLTQSMEPTLPPGTLLVVRPTPVDDIQVGEVVTYQIVSGQPAVISHRVISITSSSNGTKTFVLKGDNNASADTAAVLPTQIRGTVWYSLPELGSVNQLVNGSRNWMIPTLAGILLAYGVTMVTIGVVSAVRKRRRAARDESDASVADASVAAAPGR